MTKQTKKSRSHTFALKLMEKPIRGGLKRLIYGKETKAEAREEENNWRKRRKIRKMGLPPRFSVLLIGFFAVVCSLVSCVPDTTALITLCNIRVYSKGDPFGASLGYVVAELESATPTRKNYDYYNISPYPNAFAYGHGSCNRNLTSTDCGTCLGAAKTAMFAACPSRVGARAVLQDCSIRYEQYPFTD